MGCVYRSSYRLFRTARSPLLFAALTLGFRLRLRFRLCWRAIRLLSRLRVRLPTRAFLRVVGRVPAAAFELYRRRMQHALHFAFAFLTLGIGCGYALYLFEAMMALRTFEFVERHGSPSGSTRKWLT